MAIIRQKNFKGITTEYNCIIATGFLKLTNQTSVSLGAYVNKASRDLDINNFIGELTESFTFDGELTRSELYLKIKESKIILVSEEVQNQEHIMDENGNIIQEAKEYKPAVYEESNPWFGCEDI